jgi:hypothetical protein
MKGQVREGSLLRKAQLQNLGSQRSEGRWRKAEIVVGLKDCKHPQSRRLREAETMKTVRRMLPGRC